MGKGSSGAGGGKRDNSRWGPGRSDDGFMAHTDPDEIQKAVGNESWEKRLTDDQRDALDMYINKEYAYDKINRALRHPDQPVDEKTQKMIDDISDALDDSYLKENIVVVRRSSARLVGGAQTATDVKKMYGQIVTDEGFTSSSAKVDFKAYQNTKDVEYHIKVPGRQKGVGAYVRNLADESNQSEYEFLFNHGSSYKVLGGYETYGKLHVNLLYVGRNAK